MEKLIETAATGMSVTITVADERWYARATHDPITGLPTGWRFVPSVTWISGHYPKGIGFYKWLANAKGWDEAEAVRTAAGDKGSKIHQGIARLLAGATIKMDDALVNPSTRQAEPLTLDEYEALLSFVGWAQVASPVTVAQNFVVEHPTEGYAGTVDWLGYLRRETKIKRGGAREGSPGGWWVHDAEAGDDEARSPLNPQAFPTEGEAQAWADTHPVRDPWLLDFKSSQEVWPEQEIQVTAYGAALPMSAAPEVPPDFPGDLTLRLGLLQVGYRKNLRGWKLTPVAPAWELFLAAKHIWAHETEGQAPQRRDYPLALSLAVPTTVTPRRKRGGKE